MADRRPTVLVDFDGVIHRYSRGWADGTVYDPPFDDALPHLLAMEKDGYRVVIFSSRPAAQIVEALHAWGWPTFEVTNTKLPAVATIDDRGIRFTAWPTALAALRACYPIRAQIPAYPGGKK